MLLGTWFCNGALRVGLESERDRKDFFGERRDCGDYCLPKVSKTEN